ncbi:phosphatase PAP2 family protein [Pseudoxanthomonas suwonensis]|uniref:undecaprenyl-diphosphate phosphatase n=1 Tax=Pseudoxanthomonas suwonensis TaxID=314722 RepID=A0A0E3Z2L7_9GAMM|nr:phosphatase PAP2 family protein [Pseudoxanthomonas suwonensis]AKC87807.1 hypothetical protein WQ53_14610 [Pseudoxanthomonas suwonensis]
MFEADPNLWLQGFTAAWFFRAMQALSTVGQSWVYMPAILLLAFGVRLRPTLALLLALLLVSTATSALKHGFGLPRPSEVDARVLDKGRSGKHLVEDGAAKAFLGLPSDEAIAAARAQQERDFGFVSGHTSAAAAFALSIPLFFGLRRRWIWALALAWPLLMGISRMYLGRHFLADVLGGLALGWLGTLLVAAWWRRLPASGPVPPRLWLPPLLAVALVAAVAASIEGVGHGAVGDLLGALAVIAVLQWRGWPDDATGLPRRIARVACALAVGYGTTWAFTAAYAAGGWAEGHPLAAVFATAGMLVGLLGSVALCRLLRLYAAPAPAARIAPA